MKINTRSITLAATLAALCAVTGFLPYVFFLPVVVAATTLSVGTVAFVGLCFGCISVAYSFIMPSSLVSMAFVNAPYIAIIPRVLAALGCFGFYKLLMHVFKPQKSGARFAVISVSAAVGSLLNTMLVVGAFVLIMPSLEFGGVTMIAYIPTMLISGAIECACMAALAPSIVLTLEKTVFTRFKNSRAKKAAAAKSDKPSNGGADDVAAAGDTGVTDNGAADTVGAVGGDAVARSLDS